MRLFNTNQAREDIINQAIDIQEEEQEPLRQVLLTLRRVEEQQRYILSELQMDRELDWLIKHERT